MKVHPHNDTVLCNCIQMEKSTYAVNGIIIQQQQIPIYEVVDSALKENSLCLKAGSKIITNSNPTKMNVDGKIFYIIHSEFIVGKIKE